MPMLMTLRDVSVRFTEAPVLDEVSFTVNEGERVCLVGRNGAGKSTLMRVIAGDLDLDDGEREHAATLRIARLAQEIPPDLDGTVHEIIARESEAAAVVAESWDIRTHADAVISRLELDAEARFGELSGGLQRRVMLAAAVVVDPDLLLLDEPTNHLDIAGVVWLEDFLLTTRCAQVFISHDRAFLDRVATRLVEIDRGKLYSWPGGYRDYRRRKAEALAVENAANREFDKRLAEEEAWIRRGVKARTTRNMGRVRALETMREEALARRKYQKRARIRAQFGEESSRRVIEAHRVNASIGGKIILVGFTHKVRRGETIGVMGPNGCGKTTLLRVLLGEHLPDSGTLKYGENLEIAYFDQNRRQLDLEKSAAWNVADGADRIAFEGKSLHVLGYLKTFLFTPDRARTQAKLLSGGECNRLLLARLFAKPSNLLVLDEPTNDLDIETLEMLETLVAEYPGTIILVSHDRAFVDNVVDGLFIHEGAAGFRYHVGNYADWQRRRKPVRENASSSIGKEESSTADSRSNRRITKLSYKDQRELNDLPERIQRLEGRIAAWHEKMADPDFFRQSSEMIKREQNKFVDVERELKAAYTRWEELEMLQNELTNS